VAGAPTSATTGRVSVPWSASWDRSWRQCHPSANEQPSTDPFKKQHLVLINPGLSGLTARQILDRMLAGG
jgi:hypothetical protein